MTARSSAARPWRAVAGGVLIDIRVTPKGGRDAIDGVELLSNGQAVLKLRVRALPTDGEANAAVIALIAKLLKFPKSSIALERGGTSRVKTLRLAGDAAAITSALETMTKAET
ncbi:MAG: DUF167 domain-containing protein [Xanthobacteraceae bacterium]|nr:DUF167 domain-containing protein [Xanthobacteraceae bacterium]MCW5673164.1 DUF167 domain-containing protein [Xanthobacteraceae bacterium]